MLDVGDAARMLRLRRVLDVASTLRDGRRMCLNLCRLLRACELRRSQTRCAPRPEMLLMNSGHRVQRATAQLTILLHVPVSLRAAAHLSQALHLCCDTPPEGISPREPLTCVDCVSGLSASVRPGLLGAVVICGR